MILSKLSVLKLFTFFGFFWIRYRKIWVLKKVSDSLSGKFVIEKGLKYYSKVLETQKLFNFSARGFGYKISNCFQYSRILFNVIT